MQLVYYPYGLKGAKMLGEVVYFKYESVKAFINDYRLAPKIFGYSNTPGEPLEEKVFTLDQHFYTHEIQI